MTAAGDSWAKLPPVLAAALDPCETLARHCGMKAAVLWDDDPGAVAIQHLELHRAARLSFAWSKRGRRGMSGPDVSLPRPLDNTQHRFPDAPTP